MSPVLTASKQRRSLARNNVSISTINNVLEVQNSAKKELPLSTTQDLETYKIIPPEERGATLNHTLTTVE